MIRLHNKQGKEILRTEVITRKTLMRLCQLIITESGESKITWATKLNVPLTRLSLAINSNSRRVDYIRTRILEVGLQERLVKRTIFMIAKEGDVDEDDFGDQS